MRRRGDESEMPSEQTVIVLEARSDGQSESIHAKFSDYRAAADFKDPAGPLIRPAAVLNTAQHIAHTPTTRLRHQQPPTRQRD